VTTATPRLLCPHCDYDLTGVAVESGDCPECGTPYARATLLSRARAMAGLALNCTVFSLLALLGAVVVGQVIAAFPTPTQGSAGQAASATLILSLLPAATLVLGLTGLSSRTGHAVISRGWPPAFALLFAVSVVFSVAAPHSGSSYPTVRPIFQPSAWIQLNQWAQVPARLLTLAGAAATLRRLARSLDLTSTRAALGFAAVVSASAAAMTIGALIRDARPGTREPTDYLVDSWILILTGLFTLGAWLMAIAGGLVVRNQWLASQRSAPEPNPPAAGQ
jgi:hypothetical protein